MKQILAMLVVLFLPLTASAAVPPEFYTPVLTWEVEMSSTDEVERNVRVYAKIDSQTPNGVTVTANVSFSGDAINGMDYSPVDTTLVIPPGETRGYIRVHINDDALFENRESIFITLDHPVGAIRGIPYIHDLRIKRNDFE